MRWKVPAGVLLALALLVPATPSSAHAETGPAVIRYTDVRALVTIDLDTASDNDVHLLGNQIMAAATADRLTTLPGRMQARLDGSAADLRTFLKTRLVQTFATDLRIAVNQTMTGAGTNVRTAAQEALDNETVDGYLAYLNSGLYVARALDGI